MSTRIHPRNFFERLAQVEAALRIESTIGLRELGYDPVERRREEARHYAKIRAIYADHADRNWNDGNRRRAQRQGGGHERYSRHAVIDRDSATCHICQSKPTKIHIDHLVPISLGGPDVLDNVAVACASCNTARNNGPIPATSRYYHARPSGLPWYDPD